jgi:hypothetical protein
MTARGKTGVHNGPDRALLAASLCRALQSAVGSVRLGIGPTASVSRDQQMPRGKLAKCGKPRGIGLASDLAEPLVLQPGGLRRIRRSGARAAEAQVEVSHARHPPQ